MFTKSKVHRAHDNKWKYNNEGKILTSESTEGRDMEVEINRREGRI